MLILQSALKIVIGKVDFIFERGNSNASICAKRVRSIYPESCVEELSLPACNWAIDC
ncbi:MAG: hypothetical protein ACJAU1_001128 [Psychromonas sp.]|jgi:hypothetical protein